MEEKKAKKEYTLEEITFTEKNRTMAILSCIPIVGLILLFVEKEDNFVRYHGAQYTLVSIISFVISLLLGILWFVYFILGPILWLAVTALIVLGMVKVSKGERFDIPVVSKYALKLMNVLE